MASWPSSQAATSNKITITANEIATNSFSSIIFFLGLLRFFFVRGMANAFDAFGVKIARRSGIIVGELRKD